MSAAAKPKATPPATHNPFAQIMGQSQVSRFLADAQREQRMSHAYLFVGPAGSGKTETALALALAKLCPLGGCGECDTCIRINRLSHPDVHWVEPEGVGSYLAEQIREVIRTASLTPVRANHKLFVITRADLLRDAAANAFLKTLEEPPDDTSFVLMARTRDSVMPTLVSRCQTLVFRRLPERESVGLVCRQTGASPQDARIALATVGGSTKKACEFLESPTRRNARLAAIDVMERLPNADAGDIVDAAKRLVQASEAPTSEIKARYENQRASNADFMTAGALKYLEKMQNRKIASSTRDVLLQIFSAIRSWLRDCATVRMGLHDAMVNDDCHYTIETLGRDMNLDGFVAAQAAVDKAERRIAQNVTPQLVVETMLFDIRKALYEASSTSTVQI